MGNALDYLVLGLYFAAMRLSQKPDIRRWYEAKKAKDQDRGIGALIGIARKLALALYSVGVYEEKFDQWRLFPGRSLEGKARPPRSPMATA